MEATRSRSATLQKPELLACGQVECLNCGRTLASAARRLSDGAIRLGRTRSGALDVEVIGGCRLRCRRCGGHAFVEQDAAPA